MASQWSNSDRRQRLPRDWNRRRGFVLHRDKRVCQLAFPGVCVRVASDVDHIDPAGGDGYANLQSACGPCHQKKTIMERPVPTERHPREPHPIIGRR